MNIHHVAFIENYIRTQIENKLYNNVIVADNNDDDRMTEEELMLKFFSGVFINFCFQCSYILLVCE